MAIVTTLVILIRFFLVEDIVLPRPSGFAFVACLSVRCWEECPCKLGSQSVFPLGLRLWALGAAKIRLIFKE
jgi:hypothetical protein